MGIRGFIRSEADARFRDFHAGIWGQAGWEAVMRSELIKTLGEDGYQNVLDTLDNVKKAKSIELFKTGVDRFVDIITKHKQALDDDQKEALLKEILKTAKQCRGTWRTEYPEEFERVIGELLIKLNSYLKKTA